MELSKYYIEQENWEIIRIDDEYFTFNEKEDLPEDYQKYYSDLEKYGYSMIFNTYNDEEQ